METNSESSGCTCLGFSFQYSLSTLQGPGQATSLLLTEDLGYSKTRSPNHSHCNTHPLQSTFPTLIIMSSHRQKLPPKNPFP